MGKVALKVHRIVPGGRIFGYFSALVAVLLHKFSVLEQGFDYPDKIFRGSAGADTLLQRVIFWEYSAIQHVTSFNLKSQTCDILA